MKKGQPVFIVEEYLFFNQYNFHKQKLVFQRASMKAYSSFLQREGYVVTYNVFERNADIRNLLPYLKEQRVNEIHYTSTELTNSG